MQKVTVSFSFELPDRSSVLGVVEGMREAAMAAARATLHSDEAPIVVYVNSFESYRVAGGDGLMYDPEQWSGTFGRA